MLRGLIASDATAIRALYDAVLPSIITYTRNNNGSEADARDVFQDALMALYKRLGDGPFTLTCTLKSYLRVVCRNLWLKRLRKGERVSGVLPEGQSPVDIDSLMDARMEASEREALLWRHFDKLTDGCRDILRQFFAGTPMLEIAERAGSSVGYVKKRKHQCKEKLVAAVRADVRFAEMKAAQ